MVLFLCSRMLTNGIWIATGRCEDAPSVRQVDRRHPIRRLHEIAQQKCRRRAIRQRDRRELRTLLLRHAELHAPAEQHARDDPVLACDLRNADAGLVALQSDGVLVLVAKEAPDRLARRRRLILRRLCQAAFGRRSVSTNATTGRAEG
jgi:hypothetical protein